MRARSGERSRGSGHRAAALRWVQIALLTSVGLSVGAGAATADPYIEVGAFGGAHFFAEEGRLAHIASSEEDEVDLAGAFGLRLAFGVVGPLAVEAELAMIPTNPGDSGLEVLVVGWRAHAVLQHELGRFRPFALAGAGALSSYSNRPAEVDEDITPALHVGVGSALRVGHSWGLRADARVLFRNSGVSRDTASYELLAGLYVRFGGVPPKRGPRDTDKDNDGIVDRLDVCPYEPESVNSLRDDDGCPEDPALVALEKDPLPGSGAPPDEDGDGVAGDDDLCPDQAEDFDEFEDGDGCPEADNDGDGIADASDSCANDAETPNQHQDEDGCPDEVPPPPPPAFVGVLEGVEFRSGSGKLRGKSYKALKAAAKVLAEHPDVHVEVGGHTDDEGDFVDNLLLSRKRAEVVKRYLIRKGVDASRLTARGYGSKEPIADNKTRKGRARNRRVEFKVLPTP